MQIHSIKTTKPQQYKADAIHRFLMSLLKQSLHRSGNMWYPAFAHAEVVKTCSTHEHYDIKVDDATYSLWSTKGKWYISLVEVIPGDDNLEVFRTYEVDPSTTPPVQRFALVPFDPVNLDDLKLFNSRQDLVKYYCIPDEDVVIIRNKEYKIIKIQV